MTRETYLDDSEAREWILNTHAKAMPDGFKDLVRRCTSAFILYGNEDCPERIDFYATNSPMNGEEPMLTMRQSDNGSLVFDHEAYSAF
jgi:hypothetical protein